MLIFTDFSMPIMDGVEAAGKIREFYEVEAKVEREKQPKIIGVTGHVLEKYTSEGMKAGMDMVVAKPMYSDVLMDILRIYQQ